MVRILEGRTGALWFGTLRGLSQHDGTDWTAHPPPPGADGWVVIAAGQAPVVGGMLARRGLDAAQTPHGTYDLRPALTDRLGLTGTVLVSFIVGNLTPHVEETAPARVNATLGGAVYSTSREVHLYFPPRAFGADVVVTIEPVPDSLLSPDSGSGVRWVGPAYDIAWGSVHLEKSATLQVKLDDESRAARSGALALYGTSGGDTVRVGGTVDPGGESVSAAITDSGVHGVLAESGTGTGPRELSEIAVTPRVFSPQGGFGNQEVAISFSLGAPGEVTVMIYNRAGRRVRDVVSN